MPPAVSSRRGPGKATPLSTDGALLPGCSPEAGGSLRANRRAELSGQGWAWLRSAGNGPRCPRRPRPCRPSRATSPWVLVPMARAEPRPGCSRRTCRDSHQAEGGRSRGCTGCEVDRECEVPGPALGCRGPSRGGGRRRAALRRGQCSAGGQASSGPSDWLTGLPAGGGRGRAGCPAVVSRDPAALGATSWAHCPITFHCSWPLGPSAQRWAGGQARPLTPVDTLLARTECRGMWPRGRQ